MKQRGAKSVPRPIELVHLWPDTQHPYARVIGEAVLAWNDIHTWVFVLCWKLSKLSKDDAEAEFYGRKTDNTRRALARKYADRVLQSFPPDTEGEKVCREFQAWMDAIESHAGIRNALVHTGWHLDSNGTFMLDSLRSSQIDALKDQSLEKI